MSKFARKGKPPQGFDKIAPTLEALEIELRESASRRERVVRAARYHACPPLRQR